jgi:hypothetical protein
VAASIRIDSPAPVTRTLTDATVVASPPPTGPPPPPLRVAGESSEPICVDSSDSDDTPDQPPVMLRFGQVPVAASQAIAIPARYAALLPRLGPVTRKSVQPADVAAYFDAVRAADAAALESRDLIQQKEVPQSKAVLKKHPVYCLQEQLTKFQSLRPAAVAVGQCGTLPVYLRADVCLLHTRSRWPREGRVVKVLACQCRPLRDCLTCPICDRREKLPLSR